MMETQKANGSAGERAAGSFDLAVRHLRSLVRRDCTAGEVDTQMMATAEGEVDLLPKTVQFGYRACNREATSDASKIQKRQLTIFYRGTVLVFDNFSEDKAKDLVQMLKNGGSFAPQTAGSANSPSIPDAVSRFLAGHSPDLPLARNASLQRFLQRRKERLKAKAPYQASSPSDEQIKKGFDP